MVGGSPDYTKTMRMQGSYGGTLTTVAVDANGNIIALMKGDTGTALKTVLVDAAGRIISVMTGDEDGNVRTVALDASGRMISILRDPTSNNYLAVDGAGRLVSVMVGENAGNPVNMAVDDAGRMIAVIRDPNSDYYASINSAGDLSVVMYGSNVDVPTAVAVDDNGYIVGVFKGSYGGSLKTLATDTDGRVLAKLVDIDDILGGETTVGIGELAARLGGPMVWSRSGVLANYWDGSTGFGGIGDGVSGAGGSVVLGATITESAGYSLTLTAGGADTRNAWVSLHAMVQGYSGVIAAEFHWLPQSGNVKHKFYLDINDGTNQKQFRLQWDDVDNKVYYRNAAGNYVDSGFTMTPSKTAYAFNALKLFIDTSDWTYVKFIENVTSNTLATIGGYSTADADPPRVGMYYVLVANDGVTTNYSYLDKMVLTVNE